MLGDVQQAPDQDGRIGGEVAAGQQRIGRRLGVHPDQLRVGIGHAQRPTEAASTASREP